MKLNWSFKQRTKQKTTPKVKDQMASQVNSTKHLQRVNTYPSQAIPKKCRGKNALELILQGQHHPDTKTRQRYYTKKKRKEITSQYHYEHRCKNPQQNIRKPNSTIH